MEWTVLRFGYLWY